MRKLTHKEIVCRQDEMQSKSVTTVPLTVVVNNIRSLHNVGAIFRTADGAGVEKIWLCGITGYPPNSQISKTALGAETRVPWDHSYDALAVLTGLKNQGYQIVLLEQTNRSLAYHKFVPVAPVCLVLGHEIEGVSDDLVKFADISLEIEMAGLKNSLNVGIAFGIVAYHLRNCLNPNFSIEKSARRVA